MSRTPLVTVLMSVFNDADFVLESVHSILDQSLTDFEFLIIDDSSTDKTAELLAQIRDPRVRIVRNEKNVGLTTSLKRGVELARGRYIARLDSDDVALRRRLSQQVEFLEHHPATAILGGACVLVNEAGKAMTLLKRPETDLEIRWTCLLNNPFVHSTMMIRRQVLVDHNLNYDPAFRTAQDYDLWTRILKRQRGANFAEPLIRYRIRSGVTQTRRKEQLDNAFGIAARTIHEVLPEVKIEAAEIG